MIPGDELSPEYVDGVADGFGAAADLADLLANHYSAPDTLAALAMISDSLRGTCAIWRDRAIRLGDNRR